MTKDEIQTKALTAIGHLQKSGCEISMGAGKCLLGIKHMNNRFHEAARFLVVAPKTTIFDSWKSDMDSFGYGFLKDYVEYSTYISLPKQDLDYDVVYLDECHSLKYTHSQWLQEFLKKGGIIVGLTGTYPDKHYSEKGKMCNFFCPKVYSYETDDAIDDEILNDYRIMVHMLKLSSLRTIEMKKKDGGTFFTSEVKSYEYWEDAIELESGKKQELARLHRMRSLKEFPTKEHYAKKILDVQMEKTILFANTQAQADRMCTHSFHSKNKNSDENLQLFKEGKIKKLSAVEQLSEGITVPNLKVGIIMHSYSNNRRASQKIGRMLRLNPDDVATIHILCYEGTVDEEWVKKALARFDQNKITWTKIPQ